MKRRSILFICVGNAFRSQMAEGFMRTYGGHEWDAASAGVSPAGYLPSETVAMMAEKGIDISAQFPKALDEVLGRHYDLIVNMSGVPLPLPGAIIEWKVRDPLGGDEATFRKVRDEIEQRVQRLLLEHRRPQREWDPEGWRRGLG